MKPEHWQEVERLFNEAMGHEPGQRAVFLAEACSGDEHLRKEVERLLEHQDEARGFIEAPAIDMVARKLATNSELSVSTPSMIGTTLGHYQITSQLGKGGMGEVYQAKDRKLGRDVAIKVLPVEFARDTDRVARFQREARVLASLNHPSIAAIYGLEASDGTDFLVLELVEGETLSDRVKRGPIPVEESLKLALQIAEALEAAHEKGIVHRDLKPANIKVTPDGKVKVLDFGLAKAFAAGNQEVNLSNSPTLSDAATQQGIILGTAAYMSPEQARGKPVDKRSDIWAFGCVLYEMMTGRQTWAGVTVTDIIAAVLAKDPDFSNLPPNIHPEIRKILNRCLQKDPMERLRDVGDVRVEIRQLLANPSGVWVQSALERRTDMRTMLPWVAAALVLGAIIAGVAIWKLRTPEAPRVMRFEYELPEGQQFKNLAFPALAVSPDGRQFVYCTSKGIYLRSMDELTAKLIVGTEENTQQPFFSPDGKWVGYFSVTDHQLKKIAINGSTPIPLCAVAQLGGASWGADNTIVYGQTPGDIMRISANGGTPEPVVKLKPGALLLATPQILPDGKSLLYTQWASPTQMKVMVKSPKSGEPKELFADAAGAIALYLPTGHIVYKLLNNESLLAVPFDADRLEVKGGPVSVVEGVLGSGFAISNAGTLVYVPGTASSAWSEMLVWVDRKGEEQPLAAPLNAYLNPRVSPDGTKVALQISTETTTGDIWIWDLVRETMTRLTFNDASFIPLWTPDGKRIAFRSLRDGKYDIYWKSADGAGKDERLGSVPGDAGFPESWSDSGKTLVLMESNEKSHTYEIGMISMEGDRKWKSLLNEKYLEAQPRVSPDGRWMAYTSNESGQNQVYVRPFPEVNSGRWQISTSGGDSPLWSADGREVFYRNGDAVMAVSVKTAPSFSLETPNILFRGLYGSILFMETATWDISPDGKRFLMRKKAGARAFPVSLPRRINLVVNWTEELKQRVPGK